LGRFCLVERKRHGTNVALFLLFVLSVVFALVLRPATLIDSETIAETAPIGSRFFFARRQIVIRVSQENIRPA